jgi:hypothetical protein
MPLDLSRRVNHIKERKPPASFLRIPAIFLGGHRRERLRRPMVAYKVFERRKTGVGDQCPVNNYPHTPTHPHALQKSHPSFLITAKLLHSGHFMPFIFGAVPALGASSTPIACVG